MIAQAWKCSLCGYVAIGLFPPESCPGCSGRDAFAIEHEELFPREEREGIHKSCWKITYGLYVVSSVMGERINGQVCNTAFQITSDPPRVAIGINRRNLTHEFIQASGVWAVSILGENDQRLVRRFGYRSGREFDKFKGVPARRGRTGAPVLEEALGFLECRLAEGLAIDAGTHTIFVGDVVGGAVLRDGDPLTYARYHATKHM